MGPPNPFPAKPGYVWPPSPKVTIQQEVWDICGRHAKRSRERERERERHSVFYEWKKSAVETYHKKRGSAEAFHSFAPAYPCVLTSVFHTVAALFVSGLFRATLVPGGSRLLGDEVFQHVLVFTCVWHTLCLFIHHGHAMNGHHAFTFRNF